MQVTIQSQRRSCRTFFALCDTERGRGGPGPDRASVLYAICGPPLYFACDRYRRRRRFSIRVTRAGLTRPRPWCSVPRGGADRGRPERDSHRLPPRMSICQPFVVGPPISRGRRHHGRPAAPALRGLWSEPDEERPSTVRGRGSCSDLNRRRRARAIERPGSPRSAARAAAPPAGGVASPVPARRSTGPAWRPARFGAASFAARVSPDRRTPPAQAQRTVHCICLTDESICVAPMLVKHCASGRCAHSAAGRSFSFRHPDASFIRSARRRTGRRVHNRSRPPRGWIDGSRTSNAGS
jgi:hypothetical protein